MIALDVEQFIGEDRFVECITDLIDETKSVPLAPRAGEIYFPCEIETRAESPALCDGLELPAKTLADPAASSGVPFDLLNVKEASCLR